MDLEEAKKKYEDGYARRLGLNFEEWLNQAPESQDEAYERCEAIDKELDRTYDLWYEATGDKKDELQDYRDLLKAEYDWLVEYFVLEYEDRSW